MTTELNHRITIAAPAEKIYRALTTEEGIRAWWTTSVKTHQSQTNSGTACLVSWATRWYLKWGSDTWTPPTLVRWQCEGGSSPDWIGTTQEFHLEPQPDGEVLLKFCHGGWKSGGDHCYYCNTTWGHLLVCLKKYTERGEQDPYFT